MMPSHITTIIKNPAADPPSSMIELYNAKTAREGGFAETEACLVRVVEGDRDLRDDCRVSAEGLEQVEDRGLLRGGEARVRSGGNWGRCCGVDSRERDSESE